jgi:hypothetical protein
MVRVFSNHDIEMKVQHAMLAHPEGNQQRGAGVNHKADRLNQKGRHQVILHPHSGQVHLRAHQHQEVAAVIDEVVVILVDADK